MEMISRNCILVYWSLELVIRIASAVTGSSREADQAGREARDQAGQDRNEHAGDDQAERKLNRERRERLLRSPKHIRRQRSARSSPPRIQSAVDSIRNCSRIVRRRAPSALRVPISLVRSFTLTKVMFMIPIAPTKSERPVMNKPGDGDGVLHRIERALECLLLVDGEIVLLLRRQRPHAPHQAGQFVLAPPPVSSCPSPSRASPIRFSR